LLVNWRKKEKREQLLQSFGNIKDDYFNFEQIEDYFQKKDNSDAFQVLSDKTCNDLDFQELFMFVDRTNSKIGQQFLYNKLRTIQNNSEFTEKHENLITKFSENDDFRVNIQTHLQKLNSNEAYYITSLFQDKHINKPKWFFIVWILTFASLLFLVLMFFKSHFLLPLIVVFIINIVIHYRNKKNLFQYLASLPQLLRLNKLAKELFKNDFFKEINPNLTKSINIIDKVRNRMSFFRLEANMQSEFSGVFWSIIELLKILFLLEPLLLFSVLKQLDTKRKEIEEVYVFIGQIDTLISIASLRKGLNKYCIPEIVNDKKTIDAQEIYHPLINNCVSNNIQVDKKSILLTGSNMSGKTSFIRTIGVNVITGLTINTCFAKEFILPLTKIFSAIRISDDLMNDKSYYFEEVLTIKEMIDNSENGKPNLFLLDEIFKGTNTIERISAGKAVLSFLAKSNNIVFVSTHDIELADLLEKEYNLYHFSEKVDNNMVDFDYKLKSGKLKTRNAIRILEINNYPENIVNEAISIAKELDKVTKNNTNLV